MYVFTFQYVSINTEIWLQCCSRCLPLHSNMFLLIHTTSLKEMAAENFTFQYVSINTSSAGNTLRDSTFTFQYVSINTASICRFIDWVVKLYIPICFY